MYNIIETTCQNCGCRFEMDEGWFYQLDMHFCDGYCEDEWCDSWYDVEYY